MNKISSKDNLSNIKDASIPVSKLKLDKTLPNELFPESIVKSNEQNEVIHSASTYNLNGDINADSINTTSYKINNQTVLTENLLNLLGSGLTITSNEHEIIINLTK